MDGIMIQYGTVSETSKGDRRHVRRLVRNVIQEAVGCEVCKRAQKGRNGLCWNQEKRAEKKPLLRITELRRRERDCVDAEDVAVYSTLISGSPGGGPVILILPFSFISAFSRDASTPRLLISSNSALPNPSSSSGIQIILCVSTEAG